MSIEQPSPDRLDQLRPVTLDEVEQMDYLDGADFPLDADPVDVMEQHQSVPGEDEEG